MTPAEDAAVPAWLVGLDEQLAGSGVTHGARSNDTALPGWLTDRNEGETLLLTVLSGTQVPAGVTRIVLDRSEPRLRAGDASFDCVLLWTVLEAVDDPSELLAETARVLRPSGTLAVVAPLGLSGGTPARRVLHPSTLISLVRSRFRPTELSVDEDVIHLTARPGTPDPDTLSAALAGALPDVERAFHDAETRTMRCTARYERQRLRRAEAERAVAELGDQRDRLRAELHEEKRKRRAMLERRWWRLGELLAAVRREPNRILRLPVDIWRLLRDDTGSERRSEP